MKELNDFALALTAYRENHNLTQVRLAEMLGVQTNVVWTWENTVRSPRYDTLIHIARTLHIPVQDFFPEDVI